MFSVTVPNDLTALETLTASLQQHADENGIAEQVTHRLLVIVEELFVNFVNHGGAADGRFEVKVDRSNAGLQLHIADDGLPFNPLASESVDTDAGLADRDVGGLGLHLVRQFADSFAYLRIDDRNVVEICLKD